MHFVISTHTVQVPAKEKLDSLVFPHQNYLEICKLSILFAVFLFLALLTKAACLYII